MSAPPGWIIHRYATVPSTMNAAARLAALGARDRSLVVTAAQTAGRGRAGRSWTAPPGSALFCTLILRPRVPADRLTTLPLIAAVAVAEAIEQVAGVACRLKWPNDVWLGADPVRHKVAGILVTSSLRGPRVDHALVGVGVNLLAPHRELPPGATSIRAATGVNATADTMLLALLGTFDRNYDAFLDAMGRPSLAAWRARAALRHEWVAIEDAGRRREGRFVDIDDDGALVLESADGRTQRFVAGDLLRGPRSAQPG